jgi:transcription elongation factor Elf1
MITIPIQISLSPRPAILPRGLIRFACPRCGQHLSATRDQISLTAPCPICNGVVTVPIQSTLPPRPLPLLESHNPALIRFGCPRCGRHLSATRDQISMTAPCPSCNEVIAVPIQSTLPPGPLLPQPQNARKTPAWGVGLQVISMLLCWTVVGGAIVGIPLRWTVVGAIVSIPLLIVGRRMAIRTFICHCGNEMTKDTKICPTCGAYFP